VKIVIYDDEMLEPITFINLRGVDRCEIEKRGMILRVAIPKPLPLRYEPTAPAMLEELEAIDLYFERFRRNTRKHGEQETIMCFTSAVDLAVRLKPDWMLGQRSAVDYLQSQNDRLTDMLMKVLS
jgi:hypothetical protein